MHPHRIKMAGTMSPPYAGSRKGGIYAGTMKKTKKGGWIGPAAMAASSLLPMAFDLVKGIFKKKSPQTSGSGMHGCGAYGKRMGSKGCGRKKKGGMTRRLLGVKKAGALVTPGPLA